MDLNFNRLLKREMQWLYNNRCHRHNRRYTEHPNCFHWDKEHNKLPQTCPMTERVGFLDIEASNLKADFGYIISYCIKKENGKILEYILSPKEIRNYHFDKHLIEKLCNDIIKFDRIIVYWGKNWRFDIPFVRSRAIFWNVDFPGYKELYVTDVWNDVKSKLCLHRSRLADACNFLDIPAKTHPLKPMIWMKALAGDKKSLKYILQHNREDVISLEKVWRVLEKYDNLGKSSI